MGEPEVSKFLSALAMERNAAVSTQNQALSALLFLYREVLGQTLPWLDDVVRARRPARLPVVLSREEVREVIRRMDGPPRLMALTYAASPRPPSPMPTPRAILPTRRAALMNPHPLPPSPKPHARVPRTTQTRLSQRAPHAAKH